MFVAIQDRPPLETTDPSKLLTTGIIGQTMAWNDNNVTYCFECTMNRNLRFNLPTRTERKKNRPWMKDIHIVVALKMDKDQTTVTEAWKKGLEFRSTHICYQQMLSVTSLYLWIDKYIHRHPRSSNIPEFMRCNSLLVEKYENHTDVERAKKPLPKSHLYQWKWQSFLLDVTSTSRLYDRPAKP